MTLPASEGVAFPRPARIGDSLKLAVPNAAVYFWIALGACPEWLERLARLDCYTIGASLYWAICPILAVVTFVFALKDGLRRRYWWQAAVAMLLSGLILYRACHSGWE